MVEMRKHIERKLSFEAQSCSQQPHISVDEPMSRISRAPSREVSPGILPWRKGTARTWQSQPDVGTRALAPTIH